MSAGRSIHSPPPPYNTSRDSERRPLLGSDESTDVVYSNSTCTTFHQRRRERVLRTAKSVLFCTLVILGVFCCAFIGGLAYRSICKQIVKKWTNDVEHLKQLVVSYREQAYKWQNRSAHYEEEVKQKIEREKRERDQAGLYWGDFIGSTHCTSSQHRKYYARLLNLTPSLFAIEACKSMPAQINGVTHDTPLYCEDKGIEGVFGYWMVENDAICSTYWEYVVRKDCSAPGSAKRRYEAKLGSIHKGENPEILCLSTPITIHGQFFERPLACSDRGRGDYSQYWGVWDVPVADC